MKRNRSISIILLSISAIAGLVRGFRMARYTAGDFILSAYPQELIRDSIFTNYSILGWILFFLVGVFSLVVLVCILRRVRNYGYLIVVEGVFLSFFSLTHILITGFSIIHVFIFPLCIATIAVGILQTPKEF
jgi:hypothetical protein